jgi:hypothetical protein
VLALTAHEELDWRARVVGLGRKARIVAAGHDSRARPQPLHERRDLHRRRPLKRHDRQADDIRLALLHEARNGRADLTLHED